MPARIKSKRFQRAMKEAPQRLAQEVGTAMRQHALAFDAHMKKTRFGSGAGGRLWRTGKLVRSMGSAGPRKSAKTIKGLRMRLFIGQGVAGRYARAQEFGATITGSPWLTVPLPDNLTAAGVPRFKSARALMGTGRTFLWRGPSGNLVIGLTDPETAKRMSLIFRLREAGRIPAKSRGGRSGASGGRIRWLWVLKKQVRLRPLLGFIDTFNGRAMRRDRIDRVNAAVRRALKQRRAG